MDKVSPTLQYTLEMQFLTIYGNLWQFTELGWATELSWAAEFSWATELRWATEFSWATELSWTELLSWAKLLSWADLLSWAELSWATELSWAELLSWECHIWYPCKLCENIVHDLYFLNLFFVFVFVFVFVLLLYLSSPDEPQWCPLSDDVLYVDWNAEIVEIWMFFIDNQLNGWRGKAWVRLAPVGYYN